MLSDHSPTVLLEALNKVPNKVLDVGNQVNSVNSVLISVLATQKIFVHDSGFFVVVTLADLSSL